MALMMCGRAIVLASVGAVAALAMWPTSARAQEPATDYEPRVLPASGEGERAIAKFRVPEGLAVELFAAEPLLANPVAFSFDEKGRCYVAETFRLEAGVVDIRGRMHWLEDDLASRTVADRVAMYRKHLSPEQFAKYSVEHERVRLVEDRDGDGRAETATVFADGFKLPESGIGAGVLPVGRDVYFTCIPDLWRLRDTDGDGRANERQSLHNGYGVHVGFFGHDLHGLIVGPDGRLYFSIGDRGFNVTTVGGKTLAVQDTGSVLRCELDGSNLEVFHTGLRNPQELAFDEYGNLFTVDNNSDGGDRARLVHLVPGGDSGWRIGYQFLERPTSRGPWNAEKMWQTSNADQAAFFLPPLANISDGPSGLAYNPGTALTSKYGNHFFLVDFRGTSGQSGVRAFTVKPKGASFELGEQEEFLWGLCATDATFGPDGALYVVDWVDGWDKTGKGRIYRVDEPGRAGSEARRKVKRLLEGGLAGLPVTELARLLGHEDYRVRLAAQFELAERASQEATRASNHAPVGLDDAQAYVALSVGSISPLLLAPHSARVKRHAIWALGHVARKHPGAVMAVVAHLKSRDSETRMQAARWIGDLRIEPTSVDDKAQTRKDLTALLSDADLRVRFEAAIAVGRLGIAESMEPLLTMIAENDDRDPYLRHAGVMGLVGVGDATRLVAAAEWQPAAVRLAIVLALRRLGSSEVARFLADSEPRIAREAATAIYDVPIEGAMPQLAALELGSKPLVPLARRVLNANLRVGDAVAATRLAALASREDLADVLRIEALGALAKWGQAVALDPVTGLSRPRSAHDTDAASRALASIGVNLLKTGTTSMKEAAAEALGTLKVTDAAETLHGLVEDEDANVMVRVKSLRALDALDGPGLAELAETAAAGRSPSMRAEGLRVLARVEPEKALGILRKVCSDGSLTERQSAFRTLGAFTGDGADAVLLEWLDRIAAGEVPSDVQLDLLEACGQRSSAAVKNRLTEIEAARPADDPLGAFRVAMAGGNAGRGALIFREKTEVYCLRCHKVRGNGGEVGPDLTGIGSKKDRQYLLESLVTPTKDIAEGFETRVLALEDGRIVAGILKSDNGETLTLVTPEAQTIEVPKAAIEEETRGDSAMPRDLIEKMTRSELRDLIEFLATQR
jgi:quinoprotein glucose dehydrogenase